MRVTYGNGEMDEENVNLTRIDGRWMITPKGSSGVGGATQPRLL